MLITGRGDGSHEHCERFGDNFHAVWACLFFGYIGFGKVVVMAKTCQGMLDSSKREK